MLRHHPREWSDTVIERPLYPKCQIRMMLLGVELSFAGPDLRTFECPNANWITRRSQRTR
jgi:hypothetical protein